MDTPSGQLLNKRPDIHKLAKQGHVNELLLRLKERGECAVKDINERDARGLTPLQHAVLNNRPDVVELLLFKADEFNKDVGIADHTVKDEHGQTLAHYAAKTVRGKTRNAPEFRAQGGQEQREADAGSSGSDARSSTSSGSDGSRECMELLIRKDREANNGETEIIYVTDKVNSQTPLHYAVVYGSSSCVGIILKADTNRLHDNLVHWKDNHGMTPLHLAATYTQIDIARVLLAQGARVQHVDNTNSTPLHYVCANGNIHMVNDILDRFGDDPQAEEERRQLLSIKDNGKNTCLHIAAESGRYLVVQKLLKSGASATEGRRDTLSPLHLAVISGNKEIVEELLQHLGSYSSRSDSMAHSTPLHMAAQHNRVEIAELLLKHIKQVNMTDRDGNTPLHIGAQYGHPEMVVVLMKAGADIHQKNLRGRIPLHGAAENNNKIALEEILKPTNSEIGKMFVKIKKDDREKIGKKLESLGLELNKTDTTEDTEDMEEAVMVVREYLEKLGKTVEDRVPALRIKNLVKLHAQTKNWKRKTSVMPTTQNAALPAKLVRQKTIVSGDQVDMLLRRIYKDNIVNTEDHDGNTPLHLAAKNGHDAIVKCLLKEHHAEYDRKNDKEATALHLAAENGKNKCVKVIVEEHPNSVFAEDATCNTPLHLAARYGHKDTVDILIGKGANINQINLHKKTPIDLASEFGQLDICKQLVQLEAQSWLDKDDVSSLHLACAKGHLKVVKLLLKTVDDVKFKDEDGLNCLDIAIKNGHKEIAQYIIQSDYWIHAMRNSVPPRPGSRKVDTPMRRMIRDMPDVAMEVMDKCCTDVTKKPKDDTIKPKKKFKYNYEFIDDLMTKTSWSLQPRKDGKPRKSKEYAAYTDRAGVLKKNHPLEIMVKHKRKELLQHDLVRTLVKFKWFSFGGYYYLFTFFIHVFFLILLTRHIIITKPPHMYRPDDAKNIIDDNCGALSFEVSENAWLPTEKVLMYVFMVIGAVFEIIQLINMRWAYFFDFENYVDWIVYSFSFLFLLDFNSCTIKTSYRQDWQWSVGAFALFFSWIDLVMFLKAFTSLGLYVIMFQMVCWTFVKVFVVFFSLILAFALGFFTLLQNQVAFRDVPNSILKTTVMFLGEIDYNDLFNGGVDNITVVDTTNLLYPTATSVIFSFFITLACIVLMNLLVGLAVDDIKGILRKAAFKRSAMHIALVLDVEKVLFVSIRRKLYIKRDQNYTRDEDDVGCLKKLWNYLISRPIWWWNQTVEPDENAVLDIIPEIASRQRQLEERIDERLEKMEKQMNRLMTSLLELQTQKSSNIPAK